MGAAEFPVRSARAPALAWFDLGRLEELREQHRTLMEAYRQIGERYRQAAQDAARERATLAADPRAADVARLPIDKLARLSVEQLNEVHIDSRAVQRLITAEKRTARLRNERDDMNGRVERSIAFAERLEAFARMNNL